MALQVVLVDDVVPGATTNAGITSLAGDLTCSEKLNVVDNFSVNADRMTVDATTGYTFIKGNLDMEGRLDVNSRFTVQSATGDIATLGDLHVYGDSLLEGTTNIVDTFTVNTDKFSVDSTSGNVQILGDLDVTGSHGVIGDLEVETDIIVDGDLTVKDTFEADANTHLCTAKGALIVDGNLDVDGYAKMKGATSMGHHSEGATSGSLVMPLNKGFVSYSTDAIGQLNLSLAAGIPGQQLIIQLRIFHTNNMVVTPAAFFDGTSMVFSASNQYAHIVFETSSWKFIHGTAAIA